MPYTSRRRGHGGVGAKNLPRSQGGPYKSSVSKTATPATASMAATPVQHSDSMFSGFASNIFQGFSFGVGSAIARQAVGATIGAISGDSSNEQAAPIDQQQFQHHQVFHANSFEGGACSNDKQLFFDCLKANNGDTQSCSFLSEQLQACQRHPRQ